MTEQIRLTKLGREATNLLQEARMTLGKSRAEDIQNLAQRVPASLDIEGVPRIVFTGQYSAGKSSVLKVLTGMSDIAIGEAITTDHATVYEWSGIKVVDTPGIHTSLRPDHDELTYEEIASADLLVFVITNELMDDHIAQHFRKLSVERDKAHEMLLLVNKMSRHSEGNSKEAQQIVRDDLRKVLAPFTPEELCISFTDARLALQSREESDEELAQDDWEDSGFEQFIENLNHFIDSKKLTGKFTSALYQLEHILLEALAHLSEGDANSEGVEQLLIQKRRALRNTRDHMEQKARNLVQETTSKVRQIGRESAELIHSGGDVDQINTQLSQAQGQVEQLTKSLADKFQTAMQGSLENLYEDLQEISESEIAKTLAHNLFRQFEGYVRDVSIDPATLRKASNVSKGLKDLGNFLLKHSFDPSKGTMMGLMSLRQYSGTNMHSAVKSIGHFFGKSFKPWEAVKWTQRIANVSRGLVVVGTVISIGAQIYADYQEEKLEKELIESRATLRSGFNDAANEIELFYDEQTNTFTSEVIKSELDFVDQQLKELRDSQQHTDDIYEVLQDLLEKTKNLIKELHVA
jgi:GTPase SAR1 family protein